jgi:hypothetical protein
MHCPFCAEDISDSATVCKHCHRDFSFAKGLLEANRVLTTKVHDLSANVGRMNSEIAQIRFELTQRHADHASYGADLIAARYVALVSPKYFGRYVLLPVATLLLLDYLLDIRLYVSLVYLRLASVVVGVVLGYNLFGKLAIPITASIFIGANAAGL